jgi:hypothetical protein
MNNKISLQDFGKLVKPKVLVEAYLLCNKEVDAGDWWRKVLSLNASSKSYKKDTIEGTYGASLAEVFGSLNVDTYIAKVCSFLVFHQSKYQFVNSKEQAEKILRSNRRYSVRAVGIELFHTYNPDTGAVGEGWEPTQAPTVQWYYQPKHLLSVRFVECYDDIQVGDMLAFMKTQAFVCNVKILQRKKFWLTCSWTRKKITVLNGSTAHQVRLCTSRPFAVIKSSNQQPVGWVQSSS